MSKLNQIERTLRELEGGKFQKLCDLYLFAEGFGKVCSFGSVDGTDKTKKGTPDSYIKTTEGNFIFIEYTTQQTDVYKKFDKDIEKCFDERKTGVPIDNIKKIIICYNSKLSPEELFNLNLKCKEKGCSLEEFDITSLAFGLLQKYPFITKDILGIEVDTGQILPPNEFVKQKNSFSTPLDNKFMFREEELSSLVDQLNNIDLVILSGKPGVGKTKLALEVMNKFIEENNEYKIYCIQNRNLPIYDDLTAYFSHNVQALILVDDANRITQLTNLLELIGDDNKNRKIKLILTVRDYALKDINKVVFDIPHITKELTPFERSQIAKLLELKGITNIIYQDRICKIARGNPRLALMAANVALETKDLSKLSDASNIYNAFFHKLIMEIEQLSDQNLLKVLAVIAYFRVLDFNSKECQKVYEVLKMDESLFWDKVILLSDLEIVDLYEKQICKIVDQIQAKFFFFRIVFKDEIIPFTLFLENFFFDFENKMKDTIIPIINTFSFTYIEGTIRKSVDDFWDLEQDDKRLLKLANTFWFVRRTETLNYLHNKVLDSAKENSTFDFTKKEESVTDPYLTILVNYANFSKPEFKISLEIIFLYLERCPRILPQVMQYIKHTIGYDISSHQYGYYLQLEFFGFLFNKAKDNQINKSLYVDLVFKIGPEFLKVKQECYRSDGKEITFISFNLVLIPELKELRKQIFEFIIQYGDDIINRKFLESLIDSSRFDADPEILEFDSTILLPLLNRVFSSQNYLDCKVFQEYTNILIKEKIGSDIFIETRQKFTNETYKMSQVLFPDRDEKYRLRQEENLTWEEIENLIDKKLKNYFENYTFDQYKLLIKQVTEIIQHENDRNKYLCKEAIISIITNLIDKDVMLFYKVLEEILVKNNNINIDLYEIAKHFFFVFPEQHQELLGIITKYQFNLKDSWLSSFFRYLPDKYIDGEYLSRFYDFINNLDSRVDLDFDSLAKFEVLDRNIYLKTVRLLLDQCEEKKHSFHLFFNSHSSTVKKLSFIFKDNVSLFKKIYFYELSNFSDSNDHDGRVMRQILALDHDFIVEYLDWVFKVNDYISDMSDHRNYSFLWQLDNSEYLLNGLIDFFVAKDSSYYIEHHYIDVFFKYDSNESKNQIKEFIKSFIEKNPENIDRIRIIFIPIINLFRDDLTELLAIFLSNNLSFEDFRKIRLESNSFSGDGGSFVKAHESELKFWESILPILGSLELMEHRLYVKEKIKQQMKMIESERRRDFIGWGN